jgi:signal transduction histidine kinase
MEKWENSSQIAEWLFLFLLFILVFVIVFLYIVKLSYKRLIKVKIDEAELKIKHQNDLISNALTTQERERERIAADIHDQLIGQLVSMQMTISIYKNLNSAEQLLQESIQTARRISHDIAPPMIHEYSLMELITNLILPFKSKLNIDLKANFHDNLNLSDDAKIQLIRILQEWIMNCLKHSKCTQVSIYIKNSNPSLKILVCDDGIGFDPSLVKKGLGLKNIELRAHYLKAKFRMKSQKNKGSRLIFVYDLK